MTAPISRTQVWCKLAVLIADGLPAPSEVRFAGPILCVTVGSENAAQAWATPLNTRPPHDGTTTRFGAWEGYDIQVYVYSESEPVTEDLTRVRAIAEAPLPDSTDSCRAYGAPHPPHDGHIYECCGKVGRLSPHESWCKPAAVTG